MDGESNKVNALKLNEADSVKSSMLFQFQRHEFTDPVISLKDQFTHQCSIVLHALINSNFV